MADEKDTGTQEDLYMALLENARGEAFARIFMMFPATDQAGMLALMSNYRKRSLRKHLEDFKSRKADEINKHTAEFAELAESLRQRFYDIQSSRK